MWAMMPPLSIPPALEPLLVLLAIAGAAGLGVRVVRSLLRVGVTAAEETAVATLADVSARRGDLTGLAEHRELKRSLRRSRLREVGLLGLWVGLLAVPPIAGWLPAGYAAAALLWLLPRRPIRMARRVEVAAEEEG